MINHMYVEANSIMKILVWANVIPTRCTCTYDLIFHQPYIMSYPCIGMSIMLHPCMLFHIQGQLNPYTHASICPPIPVCTWCMYVGPCPMCPWSSIHPMLTTSPGFPPPYPPFALVVPPPLQICFLCCLSRVGGNLWHAALFLWILFVY